ncbi:MULTISPECIES: glycoside hydrolase family 15 protein [Haloferax]|uniref:Glycoside hydrolase family 15 n=1 Tax=Haloferax marinum TaxID=2666143 RepID=A0A6A8GC47_9EURY|nr:MULTISPECIES: glycoside hydrolase family 15 protein [Haloferax]KAB1198677.1 glycoside hydrolase family 15 [Haloferax sp. CBA1150]MRW97793.1 glycoside hydrolase family 15 [Haloferax marinum]
MIDGGRDTPPSDKDAIVSAPRGVGKTVLATVNQYPSVHKRGCHGALVEETSAFRSDIEQFSDLHVLLWDADLRQVLDVREDAVESSVAYESSRVPELHIENRFRFGSGYEATLSQDLVVAVDDPALLLRNHVAFERANEHTIYTLVNFGIEDVLGIDGVDEAYYTNEDGVDFVVAYDHDRFVALAQHRPSVENSTDDTSGDSTFHGHRVGVQNHSTGDSRSAWSDIYEDEDGWLTPNDVASGRVDAGVGLHVGTDTDVSWLTGIGFGTTHTEAVAAASRVLDTGYEPIRAAFHDAWTDWHEAVNDGPTGDETADRMYDLSMTSLKCVQDPRGPMIAGAFKPINFEYKFVWPRDQVIIVQALLAAGATAEARKALAWLDSVQIDDGVRGPRGIERGGTWWQNYFVDGTPHWRELQLDQVGGPIYAHWLTWRETGDELVLSDHYDMSRRAAEFLLDWDNGWGFPKKHQDTWEEVWGHTTGGSAAAIAGLRCMAEMAEAVGDGAFAQRCRQQAGVWTANFDTYCFKRGTPYGDHYVTADSPDGNERPPPDQRPDAAAFMAVWPWNVVSATHPPMQSTVELCDELWWRADHSPCLDRYPGDDYTPTGTAEDGGWPLCEAYADVVRWLGATDETAVSDHIFDHAKTWATAAGLLPERVDGNGDVRWNSNLQWAQATFVLLAESYVRGAPFGMAPSE